MSLEDLGFAEEGNAPSRGREDLGRQTIDDGVYEDTQRVSRCRIVGKVAADEHMSVDASETTMLDATTPTLVDTKQKTKVAADVASVENASVRARPQVVSMRYAPRSEPGRPDTV